MDKKLSVTGIADNLKSNKKSKFLTKIFNCLLYTSPSPRD